MKCPVKYSRSAIRDLDRVWAEVYEASRERDIADRYINDLMDKIENKSEFPESGIPLFYEDGFTGYYYIIFKSYLAFYRIEKGALLAERILLGRSDYMRKLHIYSE